jgi:UDP-glucuronate 4-epimerase
MAIHKFARLMLDGKEVPVFGSGESRRDYTYVEDIVSGILGAIEVNPQYEIINLGESQTISLMEMVRHLEDALGKKALLRFLPDQPGDMAITYADISRARRILGYNPQKPFKEGIRLFAEWFKSIFISGSSLPIMRPRRLQGGCASRDPRSGNRIRTGSPLSTRTVHFPVSLL